MKLVLLSALLLAGTLHAQEKKSTDAEVKTEAAGTDEADQAITNRKLRAETGSLSKWSASTFFDYSGGSLADPLNAQRPNITAGRDVLLLQNLSGSVGVRYRASALDSITASTGFFMSTPFHDKLRRGTASEKRNFKKTNREINFSDPGVGYTHLDKVFGVQSVTSLGATYFTNNQLTTAGYNTYASAGQTFMYDFGESGLSFGLSFSFGHYMFSKDTDGLATNNFGVYPALEYVINDTFNLRTVTGTWVYQQDNTMASDTWDKLKVYQSVGLGISITRDVFLYPNIQFIPNDIRSDLTNIAISASVNLF